MIKLPELGYEEVSKLSEADKRNAGYALIRDKWYWTVAPPGCSFPKSQSGFVHGDSRSSGVR